MAPLKKGDTASPKKVAFKEVPERAHSKKAQRAFKSKERKSKEREASAGRSQLQETAYNGIKKYGKQVEQFLQVIDERRQKGLQPVFNIHADFTLGL